MAKVLAYNPQPRLVFTSVGRLIEPHTTAEVSSDEIKDLVAKGIVVERPYTPPAFRTVSTTPVLSAEEVASAAVSSSEESDTAEKSSTIKAKRVSRKAKE